MSTSTPLPADYEHVVHPRHYNEHPSGVECIDVVEFVPFNPGNAFKYLYRRGAKGNLIQDLEKALWYVRREVERLKSLEGTPIGFSGKPVFELPSAAREDLGKICAAEFALGSDGIGEIYAGLATPRPLWGYSAWMRSITAEIDRLLTEARKAQ
jgi:hypothetical protein